jgi:cytoskeletal protein CcmA (bactofilin family)
MAMANKDSGVIYNSLTHGSKIIGKIIADKDFRIDGEIDGEIICTGKVVIGAQGFLKGSIQCTFAEILGKIEGKIDVNDTLSLRENSVVIGDIKTKILVVEPKAILQGTVSMIQEKTNNEANQAKK